MPRKFNIGDKVVIKRIDDRTPKELLQNIRLDHPRTITATFYDEVTQHTRYYLGTNRMGRYEIQDFSFRAQSLQKWERGKVGRPRTKRRYTRHLSVSLGV